MACEHFHPGDPPRSFTSDKSHGFLENMRSSTSLSVSVLKIKCKLLQHIGRKCLHDNLMTVMSIFVFYSHNFAQLTSV